MTIKWERTDHVPSCVAPWIATLEGGELTLFVQPWYGNGMNYRGIIKVKDYFTVTLEERFIDLEEAKTAVQIWVWKYMRYTWMEKPK